ncbi:MAG TPA: hypothetical protein VGR81_03880 [Candidatus Acidoferrales bacterium]|nr:hypothetical protein [Candidatus Acidoferrales bacterium]
MKAEGRLKSLLWPSVRTSNDVDYLGTQGYWVCFIVGVLSLLLSAVEGHPIAALFVLFFYYLGGVGVREHSRYAALVVFVMFLIDSLGGGNPAFRILIAALLLANLRATWIASRWKPGADESAAVPRFNETWGDKFADQFPMWLWPKIRIVFYIYSVGFLLLTSIGIVILIERRLLF